MSEQKSQRVVVINFSGNVGKTTLAAHLLLPRMPGCEIFSVDTLNSGLGEEGVNAEVLRADQFKILRNVLVVSDSLIIDVGASGVETFTKFMVEFNGCHKDVDAFIVPIIYDKKQLQDTLKTMLMLKSLGTDVKKIKPIFNRVDVSVDVVKEMGEIFEWCAQNGIACHPDAVIYESSFFEINTMGLSIADMVGDKTDYRQMAKEAKANRDQDALDKCFAMVALTEVALAVKVNMDRVYNAVFPQVSEVKQVAKKASPQPTEV